MNPHHTQHRSWARLIAGLAVVILGITGCGSSVQRSDSSDASGTKGASSITVDDLEKLLPTAEDVGADYHMDASNGDSDSDSNAGIVDAIEDACPEASELMGGDDDDGQSPSAQRSFTAGDSRNISVELVPDVDDTEGFGSEAEVDEAVDALNSCRTISYSDDSGINIEMALQAEKDGTYGDLGLIIEVDMEFSGEGLPKVIPVHLHRRMFLVGDVGVTIMAVSGLDDGALESAPADVSVIEVLSEAIDKDVSALLEG